MVRLLDSLAEPCPEAFSPMLIRLSALTHPAHAQVGGDTWHLMGLAGGAVIRDVVST